MNLEIWILCFVCLIGVWFLLILRLKGTDRKFIAFTLLIAIFFRFFLAFILYEISIGRGEEGAFLGRDDLLFLNTGRDLYDYWKSHNIFSLPPYGILSSVWNIHLYYFICAIANFLFGQFDLPILLSLNALIGSATVLLVYKLGSNFGGSKVGTLAAFIMAVHPRMVFWSSVNFRDSYLLLIFTFVILKLSLYFRYHKGSLLLKSLFYGIILTLFRFYFGLLVLIGTIWISYIKNRTYLNKKRVAERALAFILTAFFILSLSYPLYMFSIKHFSRFALIQSIGIDKRADEGSFARLMVGLTPLERIICTPFGMLTSFVTPFPPWNISGDEIHNITAVMNFSWLPFLGFIGWSAWRLFKVDRWQMYLMIFFLMIMLFPVSFMSFVGSARGLNPGFGILTVMIAFGIRNCRNKTGILLLTSIIVLLGAILFNFFHG